MTAPTIDRAAEHAAALATHEIVLLAQAGDSRAVAELYEQYAPVVYKFLYHKVSGNRVLAEDLASYTWVRVLKYLSTYEWQGKDFGAWVVTIARNLVADHYKSGRYRLEVTTGDVLDPNAIDWSREGNPETAVVDYLTNVDLLKAVRQLSEEQQECIVLRFLKGFSVTETAQVMGKNEGAVKALQYRAVRSLARLMNLSPSEES